MLSGWLGIAYKLTSVASSISSIGFAAAKASTKLGFSIARGIASVTPIPLLSTSLDHLEGLSLLPILLGETIASTSLTAASASLDAISNLLDADDEASFSLAAFVTLVRKEWAEHGLAGRSITEVARALAAWAAIQGFTKQWSEGRWMKGTIELTNHDFRLPERPDGSPQPERPRRKRAISKVSVTDDVIMPGQFSQVISADIGEKDIPTNATPPTSIPSSPQLGSPAHFRSNYETWKNLRRFSKMVLAGYGGAGLLFFGTPLRPEEPKAKPSPTPDNSPPPPPARTDAEVKDIEEDILVHVVEDAEAEAMSPPMRNVALQGTSSSNHHQTSATNRAQKHGYANYSSSYSWWNVLLGKHDREIFEGFAFTPHDGPNTDTIHPSLETPLSASSLTCNGFISSHSRGDRPFAGLSNPAPEGSHGGEGPKPPTAIIGDMRHIPRFWVLTDHSRRQVVLVVRGTMSFNELAADLTCIPENFEPATMTSPASSKPADDMYCPDFADTHSPLGRGNANNDLTVPSLVESSSSSSVEDSDLSEIERHMPGSSFSTLQETSPRHHWPMNTVDFDNMAKGQHPRPNQDSESFRVSSLVDAKDTDEDEVSSYQVHGGMLRLARAMGSKGKPVHEAVSVALSKNRGYELVLCGHSLGAGVASLLALMWADPTTCRTVPSSGLPSNRRVSVYSFAPPCITSASLSRLCKNLITSIVYSFDVVSRLSLGSIRDLYKAASWLCEGQGEESTVSLLRRALKGKLGFTSAFADTEDEKKWFIAVRKTLEANMCFAHLFPPGRVWWAVRNEALHPSHQTVDATGSGLRLYEVLQVEDVFRQIEFKGDMLSSHLPHQYDRMLTELDF